MSTTFVPPSPNQWEGPTKQSGVFTPPPISSWEGEAKSRGGRGGGGSGSADVNSSRMGGNPLTDFLGGVADTTVKTIPAALKMAGHGVAAAMSGPNPMDPGKVPFQEDVANLIGAQVDQGKKAKEAWGRGQHVEALGHGLAAAVPVVGPAAAQVGETIGGELEYDDKGNAIGQKRAPQVARGLGQGLGLVASASPKNIMEPVATGAARAVGKIPVPERLTPEGLYQSSLRPSLAKKNLPKVEGQVATGLRERIPVSEKGLETTRGRIEDLNQEIAERLRGKSQQLGPVVDPAEVAQRVEPLRQTFGNQVNPKADLSALNASSGEFLEKHTTPLPAGTQGPTKPNPMTLSDAQAEKQGTYQQLKKKYGELGSADVEAQKALARGLKEEIVKRVPELAGLNARDGALIELEGQIERMVAREGNKNILGLVPATVAAHAHNPYGLVATLMMDNPAIKSRIAIALDRARKSTSAAGIGKGAAITAPAGVVGQQSQGGIPRYAKGGVIHRKTILSDAKTGKVTGMMAEAGPEAIVPLKKLTANIQTVPEKADAIMEQLGQLADLKRRVVMIPRGTFPHTPPKGMVTHADQGGNRFIFNPNLIGIHDIKVAIASNRLPSILGAASGGMGAPDKSKLRGSVVNVAAKSPKGFTVQSTATDRPHLKISVKQSSKILPKGGTISIESPGKEIARRLRP